MEIRENVSLSELTTLKTGGPARFLIHAQSVDEIKEALSFAKKEKLPLFVLGGGSNVLFGDGGFNGVVVKPEMYGVEFEEKGDQIEVRAGAGEDWDRFVELSVHKNLWGLENLSGIPGTVGASPVQNIGAYGVELEKVFSWCKVFYLKDCRFGYRDSVFKRTPGRWLILEVAYNLSSDPNPITDYKDVKEYLDSLGVNNPSQKMIRQAVLSIRAGKFPDLKRFGTAGSFFKNPIVSSRDYALLRERFSGLPGYELIGGRVKIPTAWLLDRVCNLKGARSKSVGLFERQPLILVNFGKANAKEIDKFAQMVEEEVFNKTGIKLEREVTTVGVR